MRLKYYKLTIRQMGFNKLFVFFVIVVITTIIIFNIVYNKAKPVITSVCESSAKSIALEITNQSVLENITDIKYENLVTLKQDNTGKIIALNANAMELNRLSTIISSKTLEKLNNIGKNYVKIPITTIFNMSLLSGYGPNISFNIIPIGNVTAKFKSEFEQAGINQIRHRIFIEISTMVRLIAPFYTSSQEYINEITVAETIIVGDTPTSYYNFNKSTELTEDDALKILN